MPMINKFYGDRYNNMSVEDFIELHNKSKLEDVYGFRVGCFSDLTPATIEGWMSDLGLSTQGKVLMPETDLTDMEELKSVLSSEEYEKAVKKMSGKFIEVDKPLMWGYMTMERLYHQPQYSNKVTTDMRDTRGNDPIAGRGRYRKEGQKINVRKTPLTQSCYMVTYNYYFVKCWKDRSLISSWKNKPNSTTKYKATSYINGA